jgi:lysophospholipase L1-like esterase
MRGRTLTLVLLLVIAGAAVLAVALRHRGGHHSTAPPPRSNVSLVGDSLNVGVEPYLRDLLPGWNMHADDVVGRSTSSGLDHLRAAGSTLAPYVVISLGTNDPAGAVADFSRAVTETLGLAGRRRCVVWLAVHRDGAAYEPFNVTLRSLATRNSNLRVVEWGRMIEQHPGYLAPDGIHGSPEGYAARAKAILAAIRSCYDDGVVS